MGLSVGWGDTYPLTLPDQYIDITAVTPGRYRLNVTADAAQSVSRDHRDHGQATNEEGSHPCDYCCHGVTLSCEDVHA